MPLQNFVDNQAPTIKAAWLNALDVFYTTVFSGASTIAQVFTVLGFTSFGQTLIGLANAAAARTNLSAAQSGTNVDITSLGVLTSVNDGQLAGLRNRTLNGDFRINQRMVSGTVTLAAFVYGHDRFRAGAAGVTYTFTASGNATVLTIAAGSLQHVIEGANLEGGTYCLSWVGTAQGKIGGGAYGASGVINTAGAGADLQLEFGTGTLSLVQLELGSVATAFERRPIGLELNLCQRYFLKAPIQGLGVSGIVLMPTRVFPVPMRVVPSMIWSGPLRGTLASDSHNPTGPMAAAFDQYGPGYFTAASFDVPLAVGAPYDSNNGALYTASAEL